MKRRIYIVLFLVLILGQLQAQISFTTRVSKHKLGTDERLRVSFALTSNGGNINQRNFTPPAFNGFRKIMGPSTSQEYSYINGRSSSSFSYSYILQPVKTGHFTIGPAHIEVEGKTYQTQPVTITVVKGQTPNNNTQVYPSNGPNTAKNNNITVKGKVDNAVLVAELTNNKPYVNEAVGLIYKLYIPDSYGVVNYNETSQPQFSGFWAQDVNRNISGPFGGELNGKPYVYYILRKKLLFPQHAGTLTLKPLTLQIDLQVPAYRNFFGMQVPDYEVKRVRLTSGKKVLKVKDLPKKGQPIDFSGAVGQFNFKTQIDHNQVKMGEPVHVSLQVQGTGNLKLFDLPKLKAPDGLEVYEPKHSEQVQTTFSGNRGLVQDDYVIVPNQAGKFIIPGIRFVFFNPKTGQYITRTSDDIILFVSGKGSSTTYQNNAADHTLNQANTHAVDFRFIKEKGYFTKKTKAHFYKSKLFYTLILTAFILAFLGFGYYKYWSSRVYDAVLEQQKRNKNRAAKFLKEAKKSIGEKEAFYAKLEKALHNFLKAQLKIDTSEMSRDIIRQKLEAKKVPEKTIDLLMDLLNRCDMARYAPATKTKMSEDFADAEALMNSF